MTQTIACPECGSPLAHDAPKGLCPACLLRGGKSNSPRWAGDPGDTGPPPTPSVAPAADEIQQFFPQLEIIEFVGQGGMGAVYKARQTMLDRTVALKILPPETGKDPAFSERFTREARAMAQLAHPNIVIVFEFGEERGLYYLIMEFVDGVNLRQAIRAKQVSAEQALTIVPQICDALQYAHEEGIVHRDIKPENVLLDKKGRVKIADFGLAKLLGRSPVDITLTASQQIMGTLHYMAPEQLAKPLSVDHRADIYSLGVVFYELLTGELPLGRFRLPSERARLDARLDEVVLKTLEHEPDQRYQHASEVKSDVETISRDHHPLPPHEQPATEPVGTRPLSLPFAMSTSNVLGIADVFGIARFDCRSVVLEFEASDGDDKPRVQDLTLPLKDIVSAVFQTGILKHRVVIQTDYLRSLAELPGVARGKIVLQVDRVDHETAVRFAAALRQSLAGEDWNVPTRVGTEPSTPTQPTVPDIEAKVDDARRQLKGPALGLTAAAALAFVWLIGMVFFAFMTVLDRDPDAPAAIIACFFAVVGAALALPAIHAVSLRWYGWAIIAVVVGLLPMSPAILVSAPFAIWMLVVMIQPDVRAAFDHVRSGRAEPRPTLMPELAELWERVQEAFVASPDSAMTDGERLEAVRRRVRRPAIALTILGVIHLLSLVVVTIALGIALLEFVDRGRLSRQLGEFAENTWFLWPSIPLGVVMLLAGRSMTRLGSHRLATGGAIAAILPCSPAFVISAPIGIWAFIVLMSPAVKSAFASQARDGELDVSVPAKPVANAFLDQAAARKRLAWPAFWLWFVALVDFIPALVLSCRGLLEVFEHFPRVDWDDRHAVEFFLIALCVLAIHLPTILLLMFASRQMRQLRFRRLAIVASVVAMLPCHVGFVPGIPIGLWSLTRLTRRDMTDAFSARSLDEPSPAAFAAH